MFSRIRTKSTGRKGMLQVGSLALLFSLASSVPAMNGDSKEDFPVFSPIVNGDALRGLSTVGSAESMGAGRISFAFMAPWYEQKTGYINTPRSGTSIFVGTGAFSYGVNSYVDLFGAVSGYGLSNDGSTGKNSGLGTIRAGVQGSLPFPKYAFLRMGGQASIVGGTSQNQINTNRADGYNYFETRTGYDIMGKLMQTSQFGNEDWGVKLHFNEAGAVGINKDEPALLMLGAGLQFNVGIIVLGGELNSRTQFADMAFGTDPLWATPSIAIRTPWQTNIMAGVDFSLSNARDNNAPQALEPYRVFGSVVFSIDVLANSRKLEAARVQKAAEDKLALEEKAEKSENQVQSLTAKSTQDSIALADEKYLGNKERNALQTNVDSMQLSADSLKKNAVADSIALGVSAANLAAEKEKRTDAEKKLLSTGELLLDAVYFESGKAIISINSKPYLNIIGKMLGKYPKLQIEVAGYTDNLGTAEHNLMLSQNRADAVCRYLISVEPSLNTTLQGHGYGITNPKSDNSTNEGRLINRRVELRVTNKDALQQYNQ